MSIVKPIREKGVVISKRYQEARESRIDMNGKEWPATEEKYLVEVISCDEDDFNEETGILKGTRVEYPVDKATYDKVKFGMWANVKFQLSVYQDKNSYQPLMFALIGFKK